MNACLSIFLLCLLCSVAVGSPVKDLYTKTFTGDLTYYGPTSEGNCGIVPRPSWYHSLTFSAALNADQYASDDACAGCGVCIRGDYLNTGAGATPPPQSFSILIIDQCPECSKGDIDINNESGESVDGRWQIEWQAIDCPVGNAKLQWLFQGSNSWYMKLGVRNNRIAVTKLEVQPFGAAYVTPVRTTDNFFQYSSPNGTKFVFPMNVRVTGVNGQVLQDVVPELVETNLQLLDGSNGVQFDTYRPDGGSSGSSTSTKVTGSSTTTRTSTSGSGSGNGNGNGNGDNGDSSGGGCFAASSVVHVMNPAGEVTAKALSEVRVGDLIESVDDALQRVFSPVYYVAHRLDAQPVRLLEIVHSEGQSLKLTPNHLVFAAENLLQQPTLQHAQDVKEGHFLYSLAASADEQARPVRVVVVKEAWEAIRNPLTENQRIVVSGVACSVFVESDGLYSTLTAPIKALARTFPSLLNEQSWITAALDQLVSFTDSVEVAAAWLRPAASSSLQN